ncbi:MAG: NYN domain-containing protein [Sumerlaeia bacterium]
MEQKRVIAYIDGFNLYYGMKSASFRRYYWLDFVKLASAFVKSDEALSHTYYFTSRVSASAADPQKERRQNAYLEAVETLRDCTVVYGNFLHKKSKCFRCSYPFVRAEEKMTDVNIAVQMLTDAYDEECDVTLLISADSDLVPPIRFIKRRKIEQEIRVAFPPKRKSFDLEQVADSKRDIWKSTLKASQMPDIIQVAPGSWCLDFKAGKVALKKRRRLRRGGRQPCGSTARGAWLKDFPQNPRCQAGLFIYN